jgi:hypothetical protein
MHRMSFPVLHFEKFIPAWVCLGSSVLLIAAFLALLIVMATTSRRRDEGSN